MKYYLFIFGFSLSLCNLVTASNTTLPRQGFIENKGQIVDQNYNPNPSVKYLFNSNGLDVQLKSNGFSYDTYTIEKTQSAETKNDVNVPKKLKIPDEKLVYHFHRVDIEFINASPNPEIISELPNDDYTNYYTSGTPESGVLFVRSFKKVTYKNLYEGIDLEFDLTPNPSPKERGVAARAGNSLPFGESQRRVKYNFIIHPGADASQIRWKYNGTLGTSLTDGKIVLQVAEGNIQEEIPESYLKYTYENVKVNFKMVSDNEYKFDVPYYNSNSVLIIDPTTWFTYLGAKVINAGTGGSGIGADPFGNVIVVGSTSDVTNIATTGAFQTVFKGQLDAYITKLNSSGLIIWSTYYGGSGTDNGIALNVDQIGNIILAGSTESWSNISTSGAFQTMITDTNNYDAFVVKFNANGIRRWATYYGGSGGEGFDGLVTDPDGKIYLLGGTNSSSGIATSGSYQTVFGGRVDAFVLKLDSSGNRQWATYYGGSGYEYTGGIAIDQNNNVYITGQTNSNTGIATTGAYQTTNQGGTNWHIGTPPDYPIDVVDTGDVFIAKFNTSGVIQWSTYYGGTNNDQGNSIMVDHNGDVIITGCTGSNGMATSSAFQTTHSNSHYYPAEGFITKFSDGGALLWSSYLGGPWEDYGFGLTVDSLNNIYVGLNTFSSSLATSGAFQIYPVAFPTVLITKINSAGTTRIWSTYFGESGYNSQYYFGTLAFSIPSSIFITGYHSIKPNTQTIGSAFVASFTTDGNLQIGVQNNSISGSQSVCKGVVPSLLTGSTPVVKYGSWTYRWQYSTTSPNTGFTNAPGADSSISYSPPAAFSNTWYRRIVYTQSYSDTSSVITITMKLRAGFNTNNYGQCIRGNNFILTDTSSIIGGTISRKWYINSSFPDTSMTASINCSFAFSGAYSVKLVATGSNGCIDSVTKFISVYPQTNVGFSSSDSVHCGKSDIQFTDTSVVPGGTHSNLWNFGDGSTSTSVNVKKTYFNSGIFSVKLITTTSYGCMDSISQFINVIAPYPIPVCGFTQNNFAQCLSGNSFQLNDTSSISSGTLSRRWDFGDLTSSNSTSTIKSYNLSGTYSVKLVVISNQNCSDSITKIFTLFPQSQIGFTVNQPIQCFQNKFLFTDTSIVAIGTITRLWLFGDGTISDSSTKNKSYAPGSYTVKLITTTDKGCKDSSQQNIMVISNPKPKVGFSQTALTSCFTGNSFIISDTSSISSGSITRQWDLGDGSFSTTSSMTKSYLNTGIYQVKLYETSDYNCMDSTIKNFIVYPQPKAGFTQNNLNECFIGNQFKFDDTSLTSISRLWDLGDLSTNTNDTFSKVYNSPGSYTVKLRIVDNHLCTDSITRQIIVLPNPVKPIIIAISKSLLLSTPASAYQWYQNGNIINGASAQSLLLSSNGNYTVKIDSSNGCSSLSDPFIAAAVGTEILKDKIPVLIYPNPALNELCIPLEPMIRVKQLSIEIYDLRGTILRHIELEENNTTELIKLNLEGLSAGMYFLRINQMNFKFVKSAE